MSKFKYFVINLDRRPDRWEKFITQKEAGRKIPFVRFPAVDGTKLDTSGVSTVELKSGRKRNKLKDMLVNYN